MYPGRPRVGRDCWIEHKKIVPPRVVLRRAPCMYVVYTAQALPSPRDCRPNRHWGGSKGLPESCPTSPRWPTGAVCRGGSALHNVSRVHSRWVPRSGWGGSRGLPVQSEANHAGWGSQAHPRRQPRWPGCVPYPQPMHSASVVRWAEWPPLHAAARMGHAARMQGSSYYRCGWVHEKRRGWKAWIGRGPSSIEDLRWRRPRED